MLQIFNTLECFHASHSDYFSKEKLSMAIVRTNEANLVQYSFGFPLDLIKEAARRKSMICE